MPRANNPELRECLEGILQESLAARGLDATSYQFVAERAGISRALVQYYYPCKVDFAAGYLDRLLSTIADMLGVVGYDDSQLSHEDAYRIGCLYYGYLLSEDGGRRLLYDILKDRELTDELMRRHYEWGLEKLDPERPEFESRSQRVIEVWGGFYELMYYSIKHGFKIDVPSKVLLVLDAFFDGEVELFSSTEASGMLSDPRLFDGLKARLSVAADMRLRYEAALSASA